MNRLMKINFRRWIAVILIIVMLPWQGVFTVYAAEVEQSTDNTQTAEENVVEETTGLEYVNLENTDMLEETSEMQTNLQSEEVPVSAESGETEVAVVEATEETTAELPIYEDLTITSNYVFESDVDVNNLVINGGIVDLNGHTINVHGDVNLNGGELKINSGYLNCMGNFTHNAASYFRMESVNDYLFVGGDFIWIYGYCYANNGIIEIQGNYYDKNIDRYYFKAGNNNKVIFSGTSEQKIVQSNISEFNVLEIQNTSEVGVYSEKAVLANKIVSNGLKFSYPVEGIAGWILEDDETYEGDIILISDELNLNGHTLTVNGDLIQMSGNVNINGGKLIVNGDYRIQSVKYVQQPVNEDVEENSDEDDVETENSEIEIIPEYGYSGGVLMMQNTEDEVYVQGDFVMGSVYSHNGKLTNGKLYVGGNFNQITHISNQNFYPSGDHETIFAGEIEQTISFSNPAYNAGCFNNLTFNNSSEAGIVLSTDVVANGVIDNQSTKVTGSIVPYSSASFKNGYYNGDVKYIYECTLSSDARIGGNVFVQMRLHLNGKEFISDGDIEIRNYYIEVQGGRLECKGNLDTVSDWYSECGLYMKNANDYVLVHGNVNWKSWSGSIYSMIAGTLEIKGDFTQTLFRYEDTFMASGTHKVILSGDKKQTVTLSSAKSYFNILELKNTSEEGVFIANELNVLQLIKNDSKITYAKEGTYGWTLEADETIESDIQLMGGVLNLNGHTLTINGNLIQKAGNVNINNGCLIINGDYRIQSLIDEENNTYGESNGTLLMVNESDEVHVNGNFIMGSINSHSGKLTNGKLYISGDFGQITYSSNQNFLASGSHETIFNGNGKQIISFANAASNAGCFKKLTFDNDSDEGIVLSTDIVATGVIDNPASKVTGYVIPYGSDGFKNGYYNGDVKIAYGYDWSADTHIGGNLYIGIWTRLGGNKLIVDGNIQLHNTTIEVQGGYLECKGDFNVTSYSGNASYLCMLNPNDYVIIHGNFNASNGSKYGDRLCAGTLELKGDFTQTVTCYEDNFTATGTHKIILSGDKKQTITFASSKSYFNIVELKNTSEEGVYCPGYFTFSQIIKNGCKITYAGEGTYGWTLEADEEIDGDMYLVGDELNLNGHTLTINGNLIQEAGNVVINNGCLIVNGDYRIQSLVDEENNTYGESTGMLFMTQEDDKVYVNGSFIMGSVNSHNGKLTNGKLYIRGDFKQVTYSSNQNFYAGGNHEIIFDGEYQQIISFANPAEHVSRFNNLTFSNKSIDGVVLSTETVAAGVVSNPSSMVTGYLTLCNSSSIKDGYYNGNIKLIGSQWLRSDMHIGGNLYIQGTIYMQGHKILTEGNVDIYDSCLSLEYGRLECKGDLNVTSSYYGRSYIVMSYTSDYILVHGNVNWSPASSNSNAMSAGTLEVKGDFTQTVTRYEENFFASGSNRILLSGDKKQTVTFNSAKSYMNILEVKNTSAEGICIAKELNVTQLITNDVRVQFADGSVLGWTLEEDTVLGEDLILNSGVLNLNGHILTINGNLIQKGGEVRVNNGQLIVEGDYRIQSMSTSTDGTVSYDYSSGILTMQNENDKVWVYGDFVTSSTISHNGRLTAGVFEVKGNFYQNNTQIYDNFVGTNKFILKFTGNDVQNISFASTNSKVNNVVFDNASYEGINLTSNLNVAGTIEDRSHNVNGWVIINSINAIKNGYFSGNVRLDGQSEMISDVTIEGLAEVNKALNVNGKILTIGGIVINRENLYVSGGEINCIGDFVINNMGLLEMTTPLDRVTVGGNFTSNSYYSEEGKLIDGVLEIKGDFYQGTGSKSFVAGGNHKVILNGKVTKSGRVYKQTVTFVNGGTSTFNTLVLTKTDDYYYFSPDKSKIAKEIVYEIQDLEAPQKVTGLLVMNKTAGAVTLSWNKTTDNIAVAGYEIYRDNVKVGTVSQTTFTDTGLMPQETYTYKVAAVDDVKNVSDYSDSVSVTLLADNEAPKVPKEVSVARRSGSSITIKWSEATDNVECTGYKIYRDDEEIAVIEDGVTYKDTDVEFGKEYTYKIKAVDGAGNESDYSEAVTGCVVKPSITAIEPSDASVVGGTEYVTLKAIFVNSGNSMGNRVKFEYSTDMTNWYPVSDKLSGQKNYSAKELYADCKFKVANLASGEYTIKATLYDEDNNTDSVMVTYVIDNDAPSVVSNVVGESVMGCNYLTWDRVTDADCKEYRIYRKVESAEKYTLFDRVDGQKLTEYQDSNIQSGKVYQYYVTAVDNHKNESSMSEIVSLTATTDEEKPVVTKLSINGTKATQLTTVTIEALDNVKVNEILLQYYDEEQDVWIDIEKKTAEKNQAVIEWNTTGISEGTHSLRAYAWDGSSNKSEAYETQIEVDNKGPEKIIVTEVVPYANYVSINWEDAKDEDFAYFQVEKIDNESVSVVGTEKNILGIHITELLPQTEYTFCVVGYDTLGNRGEESDYIVVTTLSDDIVPQITSFGPAKSGYGKSVPLEITATDNDVVKEILLEYSYDKENWHNIVTIPNEKVETQCEIKYECDVTGYNEGTIYFRATAYDKNNNVSESAVNEQTIDRTAPTQISDLLAKDVGGCIQLTWSTEEEDISHYIIYRAEESRGVYTQLEGQYVSRTYYDNSTKEGVTYCYKIQAVDIAGNVSGYSNEVLVMATPDTTAPQIYGFTPEDGVSVGENAGINVVVYDSALKSVVLEYREKNDKAVWYTIGEDTTFSDVYEQAEFTWNTDGLSEGEYEFRAVATDRKGNVSSKIAVYKLDKTAPAVPVLSAENGNNKIALNWTDEKEEDFSHYVLMRKSALDNTYEKIAEIAENGYVDEVVTPELTYTYMIQSWDTQGNYSKSEAVSAYARDIDDEAPMAILPEEIIAVTGIAFTLDGTQSTDNKRIVKYQWDMGNGDIVNGIIPEYTYNEEGIFTVTLTIEDASGNVGTSQTNVRVYDGTNYGRKDLYVVDGNRNPVPYAYVYYHQENEEVVSLMTDADGRVTIAAIPGTWNVAVYKQGYTPQEYSVKVDTIGQNPAETVELRKEEFLVVNFDVHRMSLAEMIEAGIDFSDPNNYNRFIFKVKLKFEQAPIEEYVCEISLGDFAPAMLSKSSMPSYSHGSSGGGGNCIINIPNADRVASGEEPIFAYLETTEKISWLKDLYWVELGVVNTASEAFPLTNAKATLDLMDGLSLVGTNGEDDYVKEIGTIAGSTSKSVSWAVRGDEIGTYVISARFDATVMPFGENISATFISNSFEVKSGKGIIITIFPENAAYINEKYYIQYMLTNRSDRTLYNVKTSFGEYLDVGLVTDINVRNPYTGEIEKQREYGEIYCIESANDCSSLPVVSNGDTIQIGILEPGESIYGTYYTVFQGEGDPELVYYKLVKVLLDVLHGENTGVELQVAGIPSHMIKAIVRFKLVGFLWGDPVDMTTGAFTEDVNLLNLQCDPGITFSTKYTSLNADKKGSFGYGWSHSHETFIREEESSLKLYLSPYEYLTFIDERSCNLEVTGVVSEDGIKVYPQNNETVDYVCLNNNLQDYKVHKNPDGTYQLTIPNEQIWDYDSSGRIIKMTLLKGKSSVFTYGADYMKITEPESGMYIICHYNSEGLVTMVEDNSGRRVLLSYKNGCLTKVTNPLGECISYEYDENNLLIKGSDNNGICYVHNIYDSEGRVIAQDDADNKTPLTYYDYEVDEYGNTITTATDRNGETIEYYSNSLGYVTKQINQNGNVTSYSYNEYGVTITETNGCGETISYICDDVGNLVGVKEPNGATTVMRYDDRRNVIEVISQDSNSVKYEYDNQNRMTKSTTKAGVITHYYYNSYGKVTSEYIEGLGSNYYTYDRGLNTIITDYMGRKTCMTYDDVGNITSITSADGEITKYTHDAIGRVTSILYADGGKVQYEYDQAGNITCITDQNGNKTFNEYNANGWLIRNVNQLGAETFYEYDNEGRLICVIYPDGTQSHTTYDGIGNVLTNTDTEGNTYSYNYDEAGRLLSEMAPNGALTSYEYSNTGRVRKITYADGTAILYTYDAVGNLVKTTDSSGHTYVYEYDVFGNITKITNPLGGITFYSYDKYGRMVAIIDANGNKTAYEYDVLGNCIKQIDALGQEINIDYDSMSRVSSVSTNTKEGIKKILYQYDSMGRVISYTDEEGNTTFMEYDLMGNSISTTDALGNVSVQASYDIAGNLIKITDALGVTSEYTYDVAGNLIKETQYKGTVQEAISTYSYDNLGRILNTVDVENGKSSYVYDSMGNITAVTDPNGGVTQYSYDLMGRVLSSENAIGSIHKYTYNAQGLLEETLNSRGQDTSYEYDALGRITRVSDDAGNISYTYDAVGNVLKVTEEKSDGTIKTLSRTYDALNRVTSYTDYKGETVRYGYDEIGNLISLTYPGGKIVRYSYYKNGNLKTVTDWNNHVTSYEYDGNGRVTKQGRPDGSIETYTYDAAGNLLNQTDKTGGVVIQSITYTYDVAGNIISMSEENRENTTPKITNISMTYDEANRLISYNGETVLYDADGNMTYGPLDGIMTEFEYDCRNRLVRAGNTTYEYDAENHRIAVQTEKERTEYMIEDNMTSLSQVLSLTEYEINNGKVSNSGNTTYYVHGNGLLAQENEELGYLTYHYNNIGSTTAITNEQGELVRVYTYGTYGELISGDTTDIAYLYNGKYGVITDKNNLYYMRARYYNVDIKRFINQDVLTGTITNSPSLNRYAYCQGNPVSFLDPFGLSPSMGAGGLGHGIVALLGFMPVIGDVFQIMDGIRYFKEGQIFKGILCFISALPLGGDIIGVATTYFTKCQKTERLIRYGTRMAGYGADFLLGSIEFGESAINLIFKHGVYGAEWDSFSTLQLTEGLMHGISATMAVKALGSTISAFKAELPSIKNVLCFVAGTKVVTSEGNKPIEEIEPGDYVLSYNEETGESDYKKVIRLFRNNTEELAHVVIADKTMIENGEQGTDSETLTEEIICTPGHKFYVEGEWIAACELEEGDILTLADGTTTEVISVTVDKLDKPEIICNFEVEDWHNYYVSENGVLVHNTECGMTGETSYGKSSGKISKKSILKNNMLPTTGKIRFVPQKGWTASQPLKRINGGFVDRFDNVWTKGPSRTAGEPFEWDVQLSKTGREKLGWLSRDNSHLNVSLKGEITHK